MELSFRPLEKSDFQQFATWLANPRVNRWWPEPATVEHVAKEYGACTDGNFETRVYVVQDGARPIGIAQVFQMDDFPDHAKHFPLRGAISIDYFIGEDDHIGKGYGTKLITGFTEQVVRPLYPNASGVTTSAELTNTASLGTLASVGFTAGGSFTGEHGPERIMTLKF